NAVINPENDRSLYIGPVTINAYTTPNTAASVGLAIPNIILPIIITGIPKGNKAGLNAFTCSFIGGLSILSILSLLAVRNIKIINASPIIIPGIIPAMNNVATDIPALAPIIINGIL